LDLLRQAFVDGTLEVNLYAASKAAAGDAIAKITPDKKPRLDGKAQKPVSKLRGAMRNAYTR
jgi:hypothetical protein